MKTKVYINGEVIDVSDDISIPITYAISDIRDPSKKDTSYSKTVILPGTQNNNKFFGQIWNVNVSINSSGTTNFNPQFNPNLKASAIITYNDVVQFTGIIQMLNINVLDNYEIEYEVNFLGELGNVIQITENKTLSELDLSEFDHTYTLQNIVNSWDWGIRRNGSNYPFTLGVGYVYPMIDYGYNDTVTWKMQHLFPGVYLKTITDAIFNQAGFSVVSEFFDSERYKRLIIPYSGGSLLMLTDDEIANRTFRATSSGVTSYDKTNVSTFEGQFEVGDESTAPNFDPGGVYNNSTYTFTAAKTGTYNITLKPKCTIKHNISSATTTLSNPSSFMGWFIVKKNGVIIQSVATGVSNPNTYVNGAFYIPISNTTISSGTTTLESTGELTFTASVNQGDVFTVAFKMSNSGQTYTNAPNSITNYPTININVGTLYTVRIADPALQEGDTVSLNNILPGKYKQSDLLNSIFKLFKLIIRPDPSIPKKLYIEPSVSFYDNSDPEDWSLLLDETKPVTIIPIGDLNTKRYKYSYKSDQDYYNKDYTSRYSEVYGEKVVDIENDFLKGEILTELIFSPTPLVDNLGHDRVISKIIDIDEQGNIKPKASNIRLLYYGGLVSTNQPYNVTTSTGTTVLTSYPYAGHLDSVSNPNFDLSFGVPREVMYIADSYTANNIYNIYHKQEIDQISDKDSKMLIAFFKLNEIIIGKLNFAKSHYFKNEVWRLNKIHDYDQSLSQTVKCEFIKLKEVAPFAQDTGVPIKGGVFELNSEDFAPTTRIRTLKNESYGVYSFGDNNQMPNIGSGILVSGSGNFVGEGSENITILGSSGVTVLGGLTNVTLVNSNNIEVTESNVHYVNGVKIPNVTPKVLNSLLSQTDTGAPDFILNVNTLEDAPETAYVTDGVYKILSDDFVDEEKIILTYPAIFNGLGFVSFSWSGVGEITIQTQNSLGANSNNILFMQSIKIEVYP